MNIRDIYYVIWFKFWIKYIRNKHKNYVIQFKIEKKNLNQIKLVFVV